MHVLIGEEGGTPFILRSLVQHVRTAQHLHEELDELQTGYFVFFLKLLVGGIRFITALALEAHHGCFEV